MKKNISKITLFFIVLLVIAIAILSFFFYTNSRQPKTKSRAANSGTSPTSPIRNTLKGFGQIIPSPFPTPWPTIRLVKAPADNPRKMVQISVDNNTFSPAEITGQLGQIITLVFTAEDKPYNISLPELNMEKEIGKGNREFLEFQAVLTGKFTYTCTNGCSAFSKGVLTVSE